MDARRFGVIRVGWTTGLLALGLIAGVGAAAAAQGPAAAPALLKVRFGGDQAQTRVVVELSKSVQARLISEGQPVVLELPRIDVGAEREGKGQGLVRSWSAEGSSGAAKIRLDLVKPAKVERRFLLPPGDGVSVYRYVVDLKADGAVQAPATPAGKSAAARPIPTVKPAELNSPARPAKKVIVIDAGHGGRDPGASGRNVEEKSVTLAAAKALKTRLDRDGRYTVVLTRETDVYVPLETRVQIARRAGANLFISLHADAGSDQSTRGASVYTLSDEGSERVQRNAGRSDWFMNISLPGRDRAADQILLDLTQRATRNRSAVFAETLLDRIDDHTPLLARSHRHDNLVVLLAPDVPAVLMEMGFITNPEDQARLTDQTRRTRLMVSVGDAIDDYFAEERRLVAR